MEPGLSSTPRLKNRRNGKQSIQDSDCPADSAERLSEHSGVYKHFIDQLDALQNT